MNKKLKKDFLNNLEKDLEKKEMLIEYANNLPEGFNLIEDLGEYEEFELIEGLDIKDIEIVKIKNDENKEMLKILSKKINQELNKKELEEIATINENGQLTLAKKVEKSLALYDKSSLVRLAEKDDVCLEKLNDNKVKLNDKFTVKKEEDKEKEEIARSIGEEPDNILNIVRINDRDAGSKLFNTNIKQGSRVNLVRLRNNKFQLLEETEKGKYTEIKGYEVTPVAKELFPVIASQFNYENDLNVGDVRAGKSRKDSRYNLFQIKGIGDTGEGNSLLYIGVNDKSQIDMIENRNDGYEFERIKDLDNKYPRKVIMAGKEEKVHVKEEEETRKEKNQIEDTSYEEYLREKYELEQELLEVEKEIDEIINSGQDTEDLDVLYSKRADILKKLNINEKEYVEKLDEHEHEHEHRHKHDLSTSE